MSNFKLTEVIFTFDVTHPYIRAHLSFIARESRPRRTIYRTNGIAGSVGYLVNIAV